MELLELGMPEGREAGFRHRAVLVTSQRILDAGPSVVHVVPLTTTIRPFHSEIVIAPDEINVSVTSPQPSVSTSGLFRHAGLSACVATSGRRRLRSYDGRSP